MKKLLFVLILFTSVFVYGQEQEPKADIKFETKEHNFGQIKEGTLATYNFVFTNTGNAPLILSNVQPSCGCTSPEWSKEPIAPGAKGTIKAVYNSYSRPGNFEKYITVKSNASSGEVILKIKGTVEATPVEPKSPVRNPAME